MSAQLIFSTLAPLVANKVYPLIVPEGQGLTPPYIVYHDSISTNPLRTLDGFTGHERVRVQIDIYHKTFDDCLALTRQVIWAMDKTTAEYISNTPMYDENNQLYRRMLEFWVWQTICH